MPLSTILKNNKWTLFAASLITILAFTIALDVLSYQNRVVTVEKEEQAKAAALLAVQESEPEPVEPAVILPEPKEYIWHTVVFKLPEELGIDQMLDLLQGPVRWGVETTEILDGEDLYFTINTDGTKAVTSVFIEETAEILSPTTEEGKRPVYRIEGIHGCNPRTRNPREPGRLRWRGARRPR